MILFKHLNKAAQVKALEVMQMTEEQLNNRFDLYSYTGELMYKEERCALLK